MRDDALQRAMAVVELALELSPSEQIPFLERECADDPALLARARRLLRTAAEPFDEGIGARIDTLVRASMATALGSDVEPPSQIGPYTVTGVLGEGGMGVVLAARQDEPVSREVAIKLIRAGVHAPRIVARFHAERQTLATLEHPHIAKLYDAGATPEGLPYFVMERIRGESFMDYCDQRRLGLADRLRLFRVLLAAVEHAHQKTIVHCDLKPSNVLVADVDGRPVLKVIDFGIARVASGDAGATGSTGLGGDLGTLEYMSPEQLLRPGHGADTRTDVYSLGVMLYELVTGRLPFEATRLRGASPTELERILLHGRVARASRRISEDPERDGLARRRATDPRWLARRVRGDLDTILETALAAEPSRRYASVARLDDDLGRFLGTRPITARPPTFGYRLRKLVARNRVAAAGASIGLALTLGMATAFTLRLADERDRARLEAEKAREVAAFLESLFEVADPATPTPGDMTALELLDLGASRIEAQLADRPEVQAGLFAVVGRTYSGLGRWDEAEAWLSRAVELERGLGGERASEVADRLDDLGASLADAGHFDRADSVLRMGLEQRLSTEGPNATSTAATMSRLAAARRGLGDYEEAETLSRAAVLSLRGSPDADALELARALHTLAFAVRSQGSIGEAVPLYREALALRRARLDPAHPDILESMNNLAVALEGDGRYPEAESLLHEVVEARQKRLGGEHPLTLVALNNLAYMLWRTGRYAQATERFEEAVVLGRKVHGGDNPALAVMLNNLGVAQRRAGSLAESERAHRAALAMNRRIFGERHPRIAGDMDNLGRTLLARGRADAADSLHVAALAMHTELLGASHPARAESMSALGAARLAVGAGSEGLALLEEALRMRLKALGPRHPRTAQTLHDLGSGLLTSGEMEAAERRLREALEARVRTLGETHPDVASTLITLGALLRSEARYSEARAVLASAAAIAEQSLAPSDPERARLERELDLLRAASVTASQPTGS